MPDLNFSIEKAEAAPYAVAPLLVFKLRVSDGAGELPIHSIALRCQIRIEPTKRTYSDAEKQGMLDLFGPPHRWGQTLRGMLWTHCSVVVPAFKGSTLVDLPVPCTFDFNVATTKYFNALEDGHIPLTLLFSGTVFHATPDESMQVEQISWEKEAMFRLPVQVWKEMMELYYPNIAWLCVRKDIFDRLSRYKMQSSTPTWEKTLETLLDAVDEPVEP